MSTVNKVIVTNIGAIKQKYQSNYPRIALALQAMIAADETRGIQTRIIALDNRPSLRWRA